MASSLLRPRAAAYCSALPGSSGGSYYTDRHIGSRQATAKCPQMPRYGCSKMHLHFQSVTSEDMAELLARVNREDG